jgi:hypothetical protein
MPTYKYGGIGGSGIGGGIGGGDVGTYGEQSI